MSLQHKMHLQNHAATIHGTYPDARTCEERIITELFFLLTMGSDNNFKTNENILM